MKLKISLYVWLKGGGHGRGEESRKTRRAETDRWMKRQHSFLKNACAACKKLMWFIPTWSMWSIGRLRNSKGKVCFLTKSKTRSFCSRFVNLASLRCGRWNVATNHLVERRKSQKVEDYKNLPSSNFLIWIQGPLRVTFPSFFLARLQLSLLGFGHDNG